MDAMLEVSNSFISIGFTFEVHGDAFGVVRTTNAANDTIPCEVWSMNYDHNGVGNSSTVVGSKRSVLDVSCGCYVIDDSIGVV